jgi:thiol:disulfide interchange protein DsbD
MMMLGVAIWMLSRILPGPVTLALWAALAFATGFWLFALPSRSGAGHGQVSLVRRGAGVFVMLYGVAMLFGALAGRSDPLRPLAGVAAPGLAAGHTGQVAFTRIKSAADLDRAIAAATSAGRTVLLDFYADWCVSCKEMEKYTFPEPAVRAALRDTVLLQADVTANDADDQALMQRFGILGPPSILLFDAQGHELPDYRVVGFKPAPDFAAHVQRAYARHGS